VSPTDPLIAALAPVTDRVRTDVTAVKTGSTQAWTKQPLTPERLAQHLNGGPARGVCPIRAGESVTLLAVLDFDSHRGEVSWPAMSMVVGTVVDVLVLAWGAEPTIFRSSGGSGVHLYLLWDDAQDARSVRLWLAGVLHAAGLRPGVKGVRAHEVEIFPKQDSVAAEGFGNQVILPLAGASELLALDDLSGLLEPVPGGKHAVLGWRWPVAPGVPQAPEAPPRTSRGVGGGEGPAGTCGAATGPWREALAAIPNGRVGSTPLDYNEWRNVIFAIHHECGGSDQGLALAEEFSQRAGAVCDLEFLWNRVWPYVKTGAERGGLAITGRSIMVIASRYGWRAPIDLGGFEAVPDDEMGVGEHGEEDEATGVPESASGAGGAPVTRVLRRTVPPAEYRTTDQANAVRLVLAYGRRALSAADRWYVDDGKRWAQDDAGVCRYVCMLSKIVGDEARRCEVEEANKRGESDE
jgi:hypothetical protein